jgi:hypothetical protein
MGTGMPKLQNQRPSSAPRASAAALERAGHLAQAGLQYQAQVSYETVGCTRSLVKFGAWKRRWSWADGPGM